MKEINIRITAKIQKRNNVFNEEVNKTALSANDDKKYNQLIQ